MSDFASDLEARFLRYVRIDTQSDESSASIPSTAKQLELLELLRQELEALGAADVRLNDKGFVIATVPSTVSTGQVPRVAFLAHADTARASHVAGQRITHEGGRGRGDVERLERALEDARIGFQAPDVGRIDEDLEEGLNTGIVAHPRQVSVEVGHDAEAIAAAERAQQGDVSRDVRQ